MCGKGSLEDSCRKMSEEGFFGGMVRRWFLSVMEDPESREAKFQNVGKMATDYARELRKMWIEPALPDEHWKKSHNYVLLDQELPLGGSDGKQTKLMYSSTSHANTYDSVLIIYQQIENRMRYRKELEEATKGQ